MAVTLEWIRDNYDTVIRDRYIDYDELQIATNDYFSGKITAEQATAVRDANRDNTLLPAYDIPGTETRTVSLTEGPHTIQVSLDGHDTLHATINVAATSVTCSSVVDGACGGTSLPRVDASGLTVTAYLKEVEATANRCTWITTKDISKVVFISEMVLAYSNLLDIGFIPSASEISDGVLIYSNLGTPASRWGC